MNLLYFNNPVDGNVKSLRICSLLLILSLLTGCAGWGAGLGNSSERMKGRPVTVSLVSTPGANLNSKGEPAPLVTRVYLVSDAQAFMQAEFGELFYGTQELPAGVGITIAEITVRPGVPTSFVVDVFPEYGHLGVVSGFRDLDGKSWRALLKLYPSVTGKPDQAPETPIVVTLSVNGVEIKRVEPVDDQDGWRVLRFLSYSSSLAAE